MGAPIDTSVFIAIERGDLPLEHVQGRADEIALSAVTASELLHGVERADTPLRRHKRERFVQAILGLVPVVSLDLEIARVHARLTSHLAMQGARIGIHDAWIAATALAGGHAVMTRNAREFERVDGLVLERW